MKKMLALLLALLMALSCTLALAETTEEAPADAAAALPTAITLTSKTTIDREVLAADMAAMGVADSFIQLADAVAAIVNETSERLIFADNGIEMALTLKDTDLITLVGEVSDEGISLGSSLFPSYVLNASMETVGAALQNIASASEELSSLDTQALTQALTTHFQAFATSIMGAVSYGDPELGDYVMDGISYNVMVPVNVDIEAIINALNTLQAELDADETVQSALKTAEKYGLTVESGEPMSTEDLPTLKLEAYMNMDENGNTGDTTDVVFNVYPAGSEEPATSGDVLVQGNNVRVIAQFASQEENGSPINLYYELNPNETGNEQRLELDIQGLYLGFVSSFSQQDVITADCDFYFMDSEKPVLSERTTIAMEGQRTIALNDGSKEVIAIEDLTDEEKSADVSQKLIADVSGNIFPLIMNAASAMPEEVGALINSFASSDSEEAEAEPAA